MYSISKDFTFAASHVLEGLPEGHKCGRVHGHNYLVRVALEAPVLDDVGFVLDYTDLGALGEQLDANLDHRHLNDVLPPEVGNPTAENLARWLFDWCLKMGWPVKEVGVSETPKTWAWYGAPQ